MFGKFQYLIYGKIVQTCANMCKRVQTCATLAKLHTVYKNCNIFAKKCSIKLVLSKPPERLITTVLEKLFFSVIF